MRPIQTMGFCCMKPNGPIPSIQPMVVAAALPSATRVKIVPCIRSRRRRNVAIPVVDGGVRFVSSDKHHSGAVLLFYCQWPAM